jgi:hypothetical protein
MNTTITDEIRHYLATFEEAVRETRDHITELDSLGRYRASAPYLEKYRIADLMDAHGLDDATKSTLTREFERVTADLNALEQSGGKAYRDQLFADLCTYTECYYSSLCYHELGMCDTEVDRDLFMRDRIAVLLRELRADYDLAAIGQKVAALDDAVLRMASGSGDGNQGNAAPGDRSGASDRLSGNYSCDAQEKKPVSSR